MKKFDQANSKDFLTLQKHITGLETSNRKLVQLKDALYESEELHRITLGSISDAVFVTKNSGEFTYVCPNASVIFGYSPEEVHDLGYIQKLLGEDIFDPAEVEASGEIQNIEKEITDKNETKHTVLINIKSVSIKGGTILYTCRDFTERRAAEKKVEHLNSVLLAITGVNELIVKAKNRSHLLQDICESLIKTRGYFNAWIVLLEKSGDLKLQAAAGLGKCRFSMAEQLEEGVLPSCALKTLEQPDVVVIQDPFSACSSCPLSLHYSGRSAFSALLKYSGNIYGMLIISIPREFITMKEEISLFQGVAKNISFALYSDILKNEQNRSKKKLHAYQNRLKSMSSELALVEENERRRIATDLHDRIGQNLAFSKIKLGALQESAQSGPLAGPIIEIRELIEQTINDTRSLVFELSPPVLYELGLEAALEWLVENIHKQHGLLVTIDNDGKPKPVDDHSGIIIFQAVRELLINIVKHACADRASVSIRTSIGEIRIKVEDKGKGFDTSRVNPHSVKFCGFGLFSTRERIEYIGGKFKIESQPRRGTKVTITAPITRAKMRTINLPG